MKAFFHSSISHKTPLNFSLLTTKVYTVFVSDTFHDFKLKFNFVLLCSSRFLFSVYLCMPLSNACPMDCVFVMTIRP